MDNAIREEDFPATGSLAITCFCGVRVERDFEWGSLGDVKKEHLQCEHCERNYLVRITTTTNSIHYIEARLMSPSIPENTIGSVGMVEWIIT